MILWKILQGEDLQKLELHREMYGMGLHLIRHIWQKQETWIHWIFPTWEKFVINNGGNNNNNDTNKDCHKMTQKPFMIFTHFDLNSSSFRTDSKQIVSSRSIYTCCTGVLTHLKNMDSLQTVSSFRLFIIYFDSQKCDFLCSSSRAHFCMRQGTPW